MITISICLSDLPKDAIRASEKNGKKYMNLCVARRREASQFGETHTVFVSYSKEEREMGAPTIYVGSGKEFAPQTASPDDVATMEKATTEQYSDLPFWDDAPPTE
jgi:hypothetical protein